MRDILISSAVCVACLLLALVSQLVAPSTVEAAAPAAQAAVVSAPSASPSAAASAISAFELDPGGDAPSPAGDPQPAEHGA